MHIGLLTTSYPRHPADSAGRFVYELCHWLAGVGDHVDVLAPAPIAPREGGNVRVTPVDYGPRPLLFYRAGGPDNLLEWRAALQVPRFMRALTWAARRQSARWDGMISHWLAPCALAAALARPRMPHLAVAHSSDVRLLCRHPLVGSATLELLARTRCQLVVTSRALFALLATLPQSAAARRLLARARISPMGIVGRGESPPSLIEQQTARQAARQAAGLAPQQQVVLFLGRLIPLKGVDVLLRACATLPRVTLVVAGDGPELEPLQQLARTLAVDARFVGPVDHAAKARWLAAANIFALPSRVLVDGRTDSLPVSVLEALDAALPVVASHVGGLGEVITDGESGLLVPPGDLPSLARALATLSADPALRQALGARGAATARAYHWDRVGPLLRSTLLSR